MAISQKVKKEYLALVAELNKHNDLYHNQDSPEISDQEYDQLFKKLLVLERKFPNIKALNSPSERVGSEPVSGLRPFNHRIPMLSLDNAFDDQDIEDFEKRFLNKLKRLRELRLNLNENNDIDQVINSFKPPIFWKDKNVIKQQIKLWKLDDIESFIVDLNNTESLIKKNPQISNQSINNMILNKVENTNIQI